MLINRNENRVCILDEVFAIYFGGNLTENKTSIIWNDYSQTITNDSVDPNEPLVSFGHRFYAATAGPHYGCTFLEGLFFHTSPQFDFVTDNCYIESSYACIRPYNSEYKLKVSVVVCQ